jgi:hypothetical protein
MPIKHKTEVLDYQSVRDTTDTYEVLIFQAEDYEIQVLNTIPGSEIVLRFYMDNITLKVLVIPTSVSQKIKVGKASYFKPHLLAQVLCTWMNKKQIRYPVGHIEKVISEVYKKISII